jgi:acyl carrier protein
MAKLDDELIDLIVEEALIDRDKVVREATLETIGLDSVDMVSVVFAVEEKYGVEIPENAFEKVDNLGQMLDVLETLIEQKKA